MLRMRRVPDADRSTSGARRFIHGWATILSWPSDRRLLAAAWLKGRGFFRPLRRGAERPGGGVYPEILSDRSAAAATQANACQICLGRYPLWPGMGRTRRSVARPPVRLGLFSGLA